MVALHVGWRIEKLYSDATWYIEKLMGTAHQTSKVEAEELKTDIPGEGRIGGCTADKP